MRDGKEEGFTYIGLLVTVAVMGAGLAAIAEITSFTEQREKEAHLLFVGDEIRRAIGSYYERSPGPMKKYPATLEALLEDKRFPMPQRHLRKPYADPITGKNAWGLVEAPGGGIMGVYSLSKAEPVRSANFKLEDMAFAGATQYAEWRFLYSPPSPPAAAPGAPGAPAKKPGA